MVWIDSHCHLDHVSFKHDLPEVLRRANQKGIHQFIIPSIGFYQWQEQQQLASTYPNIFNAFGVHPWFCDLHQEAHLEQLEELLPQAIAIGECGLDLMPGKPKIETQQWWFTAQLGMAERHDLPLIIHCVKAGDLVMQGLKAHPKTRGVIHGFSGSFEQANAFIKQGFHIGIGTRRIQTASAKTIALIRQLPLESLLLETDAPDGLGKNARNEPSEIILVANIIAKLRNQESEVILSACSKNAQELFKL